MLKNPKEQSSNLAALDTKKSFKRKGSLHFSIRSRTVTGSPIASDTTNFHSPKPGLDPVTIVAVFSPAQHAGEKQTGDEDCFVLKLDTDPSTLSNRSDSAAEIIRHVMVGYFSQRSGLLVHLEDSQLTRIQYPGAEVMYWETTISSSVEDYRPVDGVMVAHSGRSTVNLVRFGFGLQVSTRMEEVWSIDDVVFNVPGLSTECFIPPQEVQSCCHNYFSFKNH